MTESKSVSNVRIPWIDAAKGLGMLLVILGHCVYQGGFLHNYIFSFHMPLFFILSGICYKAVSVKTVIVKKTKSLILPYIWFSLLGLALTLIIPEWRGELTIKGLLTDIYLCSPSYVNVSSIWFLVCLFVVTVVFSAINKDRKTKRQWVWVTLLAIGGFIFAYFSNSLDILPCNRLPFNIDTALVSILFFAIGYYFKSRIMNTASKCDNLSKLSLFIIVAALVTVLCTLYNGRVNLHGLIYKNVAVYIIGSLAGSALTVLVALGLSHFCPIKRFLEWVGKNSLLFIGFQSILIRLYITGANKLLSTDYKLYHLEGVHVLLSFMFVTLLSIVFVIIVNKIKVKIGKKLCICK